MERGQVRDYSFFDKVFIGLIYLRKLDCAVNVLNCYVWGFPIDKRGQSDEIMSIFQTEVN